MEKGGEMVGGRNFTVEVEEKYLLVDL